MKLGEVGHHQHPGPENQDSQHMIDQPRCLSLIPGKSQSATSNIVFDLFSQFPAGVFSLPPQKWREDVRRSARTDLLQPFPVSYTSSYPPSFTEETQSGELDGVSK